MPPNPDQAHQPHNIPHHFNTFNLHTHGLHVAPDGISDNVFREFAPFDPRHGKQKIVYVSEIDMPDDHEGGTSGTTRTSTVPPRCNSSAVWPARSSSRGAVDRVPQIAAAEDVVVCISELKLANGRVPDLMHEDALRDVPSTFLVNGKLNPTITLRAGEVQRWRLINAGAFTVLTVQLSDHKLHQIARDGLTFRTTATRDLVTLPMGGRADVLVTSDRPGTYVLSSGTTPLMTAKVIESTLDMELPSELPGTPTLPLIGPHDLTPSGRHGNGRRTLIFQTDEHAFTGNFTNAFRILGNGATPATIGEQVPGDPSYGRFDANVVNHQLRLGDVEEWTLLNRSPMHANHPFHLHTNPFLVVAVDGRELPTPVWQDTISINQFGSVVIRVRFERFRGKSVLHCHHLRHEDEGMMQVIEYV